MKPFGLLFIGPGRVALDNGRAWYRHPVASAWIFLLIVGYGLILYAIRDQLQPVPTNFGTVLYFAAASVLTVGYGDVVPAHGWRVLAALEGINGFLLIGWSTAYLIAAGTRVGPFRVGEHF